MQRKTYSYFQNVKGEGVTLPIQRRYSLQDMLTEKGQGKTVFLMGCHLCETQQEERQICGPLNYTGLNCVGPLTCRFFSMNPINVFSKKKKKSIFSSL